MYILGGRGCRGGLSFVRGSVSKREAPEHVHERSRSGQMREGPNGVYVGDVSDRVNSGLRWENQRMETLERSIGLTFKRT